MPPLPLWRQQPLLLSLFPSQLSILPRRHPPPPLSEAEGEEASPSPPPSRQHVTVDRYGPTEGWRGGNERALLLATTGHVSECGGGGGGGNGGGDVGLLPPCYYRTAASAGEGVTDEREGGGDVWGECSSSLGEEVGGKRAKEASRLRLPQQSQQSKQVASRLNRKAGGKVPLMTVGGEKTSGKQACQLV